MPSYLCLSATFLDPRFHGRRDGQEPEWPPSPLRVYQALTAAAAGKWRDAQFNRCAAPALRWLEQQPPPTILAPQGKTGQPVRLSVPNNAMDIVANAWCRGNYSNSGDANPAKHRTLKTVCPTHLVDGDTVYYLWSLPEPVPSDLTGRLDSLCEAARNLVALGWGIDLVAGHGRILNEEEASQLSGQRWCPTSGSSANVLRGPTAGTLDALVKQHAAFLARLSEGDLAPVPSLSTYNGIGYRREHEPMPRPFAAFQLLKPDASGFQPYSSVRKTCVVAGMMRRATAEAARANGWEKDRIDRFILGHGKGIQGQACDDDRFAYLPLPSLESRGSREMPGARVVTDIRRVLVVEVPSGNGQATQWAQRGLSGQDLTPKPTDAATRPALLALLPDNDRKIEPYVGRFSVWSTVTPVLLPGYDDPNHLRRRLRQRDISTDPADAGQIQDRLARRIEDLLRKAIVQAGYPSVLAQHATLEWRNVGFRPGLDLATRFRVPVHLTKFPRYHVRIRWSDASGSPFEVNGPICLGAGRFYGLGLFAGERSEH